MKLLQDLQLFLLCLSTMVAVPNVVWSQATTDDRERLLRAQEQQEQRDAANGSAPGLPIAVAETDRQQDLMCFEVQHIDVQGIESLSANTASELIEPYLNSCMGQNAVDSILQVLTQAYLDIGLITSRAYVPAQDLSTGILQIVVVEGQIEDVVLAKISDGVAEPGKTSRFTFAFPTKPGRILNLRDLEQGMDQINRVPSAQGQLDIAPGNGIGGSVLNVAYADEDRVRLNFDLSHYTTEAGYTQSASLGFNFDNALGINDTFYLGLSGGENSNTLSTIYTFPIGNLTITAKGNYSESLSQLTATSELFEPSTSSSLSGSWMLSRNAKHKTRLEFQIAGSNSRRYVNGTQLTPQRIATARLGVRHESFGQGKYFAANLGLTAGRLTSDASGLVSGSGPQKTFGIFDLSLTHQKSLEAGGSLYTVLSAQYANNPLFSPQQMSIGGNTSLRGINGSSVAGDNGMTFSTEYSFAQELSHLSQISWIDSVSPFVFIDAGIVSPRDSNSFHAGLSLGAGAKLRLGKTNFDFSVGFPIKTTGSVSAKGPELSLQLSTKVF